MGKTENERNRATLARVQHERYWKEVYRVWFAHLLLTPVFSEYIEEAYHRQTPLEKLSPAVKIVSGYDQNWVYPLLPDLWDRFPCMEDFDRLWTRWNRFPAFSDFINNPSGIGGSIVVKRQIQLVDSDVLSDLTKDMNAHLPSFLDEMARGEIDQGEVIDWITWRISTYGDGGLVLKLANPEFFPKRDILTAVGKKLESFPDLRLPPAGEISPSNGPVRFSAPVSYDSGCGMGSVNVLKRNLTFYVLAELHDFGRGEIGYERILKGQFSRSILPFGGEIDFSTGSTYEKTINENLGNPGAGSFHRMSANRRVRRRPGETIEIRQFGKWVRGRVSEAKMTLEAVSQGWFPRIPNNSTR